MNSATEPLRGKVARILNSRELALNIGSKQGVTVGMMFDVLDTKGEDITDPDTGKSLGSLSRPKVRVKITRVEPKLSVGATFRKRRINRGGSGASLAGLAGIGRLFEPPDWVDEYETLKTVEKTWEDLEEEQSYVKTGDPVVQVIDQSITEDTKGTGTAD